MATQFLKNRTEIVDVDRTNPLPIEVIGEIVSRTTDTLIGQASVSISSGVATLADLQLTHTDLLGSTNPEASTLVNTSEYRGIVLFLHHNSTETDTLHYRIYGRATAPDGVPFIDGWSVVKEGSVSWLNTNPQQHIRIDIGFDNSQEAFFDQYRVVVGHATGGLYLYSKVVGVR